MAFNAKMAQKRNCVWLQALQCLFVQRWLPLGISQSTTEAVAQNLFFGFLLFFIVYLVYHLEKKAKTKFKIFPFFYFFLLLKVPWLPSPRNLMYCQTILINFNCCFNYPWVSKD